MSQKALMEAAILTFEELGFLFASVEVEEAQRQIPLDVEVRVDFEGPLRGAVVVRVPEGMLSALASNMLGEDSDPPVALQLDALKEAANVICGNLLPKISSPKEVFRLGTPTLLSETDTLRLQASVSGVLRATVQIGLDEGWAEVLLYVAEPR